MKDSIEITSDILEAFSNKQSMFKVNKKALISSNNNEYIKNMIYEIDGKFVMLDSDLAILYQCKSGTKEINQAVKNNLKKFPQKYSWVLSDEERLNLRSKILTSSLKNNYGGRRYNIRVFTEAGVVMLATILKTDIAVEMSIKIVDAFVAML